jgi:hypothetical protein
MGPCLAARGRNPTRSRSPAPCTAGVHALARVLRGTVEIPCDKNATAVCERSLYAAADDTTIADATNSGVFISRISVQPLSNQRLQK